MRSTGTVARILAECTNRGAILEPLYYYIAVFRSLRTTTEGLYSCIYHIVAIDQYGSTVELRYGV